MKQFIRLACALFLVAVVALPVFAHGVRVTPSIDPASGQVTVIAEFDTGEPLVAAQVAIFAPNDLANPWGTGVTDESGSYSFFPDYTVEGYWEIQVRLAGHGGLVSLEIRSDMAPDDPPAAEVSDGEMAANALTFENGTQIVISGDAEFIVSGDVVITASGTVAQGGSSPPDSSLLSGLTPAQVAVMAVSVIWGFVGTALYFSGRRHK